MQSFQRDAILNYLERLAESTGNAMPDCDEVHLPFFRKTQVDDNFVVEFKKLHGTERPVLSNSYFLTVWVYKAPQIKVRKWHRFTKCSECEELRAALGECGTNQLAASQLRTRRQAHIDMVKGERQGYAKKCERAILYPTDYYSLIVDGADQSSFGMPHFVVNTKTTTGHALKVKLIGVLEYSSVKRLSLYTLTDEFETGANHIIEAVHRCLTVRSLQSPFPQTLYLQVDNCTRENKNRFFFAYVECLVAWGVFAEVHVSFLPIGHTHADIDQTFSCTSRPLTVNDAITLDDLHRQLRMSFTSEPPISAMRHIIKFFGLCKEEKCLRNVTSFSQFRYFKFYRSVAELDEETGLFSTGFDVRIKYHEAWQTPGTRELQSGFIKFVPIFSNTPATPATASMDMNEVNKRLESEDGRVDNTSKMRALRALRDTVYTTRLEPFHWDLNQVLELKERWLQGSSAHLEDCSDGGEESVEAEREPRTNYEYHLNELVAVRPAEPAAGCPFWIGKINSIQNNDKGLVHSVNVHWHEIYCGTYIYKAKYGPSYLQNTEVPWGDEIHVDSIMVTFERLSAKRCLPKRVCERILAAVNVSDK